MRYAILFGLLLAAAAGLLARSGQAAGQAAIEILSEEVDVRYPFSVSFTISVASADAEIEEARLLWRAGLDDAFDVHVMRFSPSANVNLQFPLNAQFLRLPPFAKISYRWQFRDAAGNEFRTEQRTIEYTDTRHTWQELENGRIRMLWYGLDAAAAENLFIIADSAYQRLQADFGIQLEVKPAVIIYPDQSAFTEFQALMNNVEFVIGRYFPGHDITVNLVTEEMDSQLYAETLAHELSHLYSDNYYVGFSRLPLWLEEGLATYNEDIDSREHVTLVTQVAANGALIPFIELPEAIRSSNIRRVNLAYAEGATVFKFIEEQWGQSAVAGFLEGFRRTTRVDHVTQDIFGLSASEFEMAWRAWLGFPVDTVPVLAPSPTLIPLVLLTPTYAAPGG